MVHYLARVIVVDDVLGLHRCIVAAAVAVNNGTTQHFQIGFVQFWQIEW